MLSILKVGFEFSWGVVDGGYHLEKQVRVDYFKRGNTFYLGSHTPEETSLQTLSRQLPTSLLKKINTIYFSPFLEKS